MYGSKEKPDLPGLWNAMNVARGVLRDTTQGDHQATEVCHPFPEEGVAEARREEGPDRASQPVRG